jgi:hypothetical protein
MNHLRDRSLWFGLWGAPTAWSVQLLVDYAVAAYGCYPHRTPLMRPAVPVQVITAIVGGIALVVALAALTASARSWLAARRAGAPAEDEARAGAVPLSRIRFMAVAGFITSLLFACGVVLNAISPALVPSCW